MRSIAGFSSFNVHYEMFGYIIHYCKERQYSLTIYCDFRYESGFIDYYNKIFQYPHLRFLNLWSDFEHAINHFDAIVLFTDDDPEYNVYNPKILNRTLLIEHCIFRRRQDIPIAISTRPFDFSLIEEAKTLSRVKNFTEPSGPHWALPTYPLIQPNQKTRLADLPRQTIVCILGGFAEYNMELIHRLQPLVNTDPKIKIYAISRHMEMNKFDLLNRERFEIEIHKNIPIQELIDILNKSDFLLTDVSRDNEYNMEKILMSGCIPMAFSFLIPLIISKQTNKYYQFQNVIEFDKYTHSPIPLHPIEPQKIREECEQMVEKNMNTLDMIFEQLFTAPLN
jgi:hypothetical protein